nr:alpha-glucosidase/alpha-galactosidase [uncultured Cohaesibacter sp.]
MKNVKIAYIGGGSQQWALHLMADLALSKSLSGSLVLYDINNAAAEKNKEVSKHIFSRPEATGKFVVEAEPDLDRALSGADFVVISIEPGPTENRYIDLKIPEKYGIYQSVGDTTGPGGIARAIRSIPVMAEFANRIMAVCPDAWVINYTNPMAWCTAALTATQPKIKAVGCCHEVFHTQEMLGRWVSETYNVPLPARHDIKLDISGVNHFTFATGAQWNGKDIFEEFKAAIKAEDVATLKANAAKRHEEELWFDSDFQIAKDLFKRFGVLGAAGDRHLAEFVPWYLGSGEELNSWGVVLTPYEWRIKRQAAQDEARQKFLDSELKPSGEEGVLMIEALSGATDTPCRTQVNMPNIGQNASAPKGCVVESYGLVSENKIETIACGILPPAVQALEDRVLAVQQLVLEGVLENDKSKIFSGFMIDPLISIAPRACEEMFEEMWAALEQRKA